MSFWWLAVSSFVHANIILLLIALLPFPTAQHWRSFFKIPFVKTALDYLNITRLYYIIAFPCGIQLGVSVQQYYKYSQVLWGEMGDAYMQKDAHIALLMAQRNYWISGTALLLCLIMPRMISILTNNAILTNKMDTIALASSAFRELIYAMEVDKKASRNGGIELTLLRAMRTDLEHMQNSENSLMENQDQAQDLRTILAIYEHRQRERSRQNRIYGPADAEGDGNHRSSRSSQLPRRPLTLFSIPSDPNSSGSQNRDNLPRANIDKYFRTRRD